MNNNEDYQEYLNCLSRHIHLTQNIERIYLCEHCRKLQKREPPKMEIRSFICQHCGKRVLTVIPKTNHDAQKLNSWLRQLKIIEKRRG